jgi:tetratricopeptide (TPR) repeat protein
LVADFDLEAPGIDTFDLLRPRESHPGIVEYVHEYAATRVAPDTRDFIHEVVGVGQKGGRLWVMPAGGRDKEYSRKLGEIDWKKLYDEGDGFLMFEDLKTQWKTYFQPDYLLIDSRTGHNDTAGICTRQLPDAVVVLFFPNEQNLLGLGPLVESIRSEGTMSEDRRITTHFVMSNVPDLDDEMEILAGLQARFRKELGYRELAAIIHRYDSLYLLKQSLFIAERPKSRLAKEYRDLMTAITECNVEDREAVIRTLRRQPSQRIWIPQKKESERTRVDEILKFHAHDAEIMYLLGMDLKQRGRTEQAQMLLARAMELGYRSPEALLEQAEMKKKEDDLAGASQAVCEALDFDCVGEDDLVRAIEILEKVAPDKLLGVPQSRAFQSIRFGVCLWIANEMKTCRQGLEASLRLLSRYREDPKLSVNESNLVRSSVMLSLIGLSRLDEAMQLFGRVRPAVEDLGIHDCFNYAMAEWGTSGTPPIDMFDRLVCMDQKCPWGDTPNYHQCLAIAYWAARDKGTSLNRLQKARDRISETPKPEFSCWRYMQVSPREFNDDCNTLERLIAGESVVPAFFGGGKTKNRDSGDN